MAYTNIIPVHRLDNALHYVMDEAKTSQPKLEVSLEDAIGEALNKGNSQQELFVDAIGCTCETAFEDMCQIKKMWHKEKGVQGFHLIQSFAPGEVSPQLAHKIGMELAQELLGDEFQVVVSTHLDRKHIHNHLVWNSVSMRTGKKYRSNEKSYVTVIRSCSDRLCQKYGLSIIQTEKSESVARLYAQWMAEQAGQPTWKTSIKEDIDSVVTMVFTWKQFLNRMEGKGYTFRLDRIHVTLTPPGKQRPVRLKTLGRNYTPEALQRRILSPKRTLLAGRKIMRSKRLKLCGKGWPVRRVTGLRALYLSYLYKMGISRKKPRYCSYAVRADIRRLDQRIEQMRFLSVNRIDSREQLYAIRIEKEKQIAVLVKQRQKLYRYEPKSPQIPVLTEQLQRLRKTVKLCRNIEQQSVEMEQRMQAARQEEQQWRERSQTQKYSMFKEQRRE